MTTEPAVPLHKRQDWHVSRHWAGTRIEDECPCPKAPCGMVPLDQVDPACGEHPPARCKSIRRSHLPEECEESILNYAVSLGSKIPDYENED